MSQPKADSQAMDTSSERTASTTVAKSKQSNAEVTDQAVLDYLQKKGMGTAVLELTQLLETKKTAATDDPLQVQREALEQEDALHRNQRSLLTKSTGGGLGYDRDAAWPILQWGLPDTTTEIPTKQDSGIGVPEAQSYLYALVQFQVWVLSLPEVVEEGSSANPLKAAYDLIKDAKDKPPSEETLKALLSELGQRKVGPDTTMPLSPKPELLAVAFALFIHTYCELLEVGMEGTAQAIRDAFAPLYQPLYSTEFADLFNCTTTEDIMRLNSHNSQHMEALASLKSILVQVASYQLRRKELQAQSTMNPSVAKAAEQKLEEYSRNISLFKAKHRELSQRASLAFEKMVQLPFLRRARAVRWQLTLSNSTYGMLVNFFEGDSRFLSLSALLHNKCELRIEKRAPLPYTPACVLEVEDVSIRVKPTTDLNNLDIVQWAAPGSMEIGVPFPKYDMEETYDDKAKAARAKAGVEFNRALLVNGFRRLEAVERYQGDVAITKRARADPLEPTILLSTLCATSSGPSLPKSGVSPVHTIWEESGINITCARSGPADGRYIAVGGDDASVRIFSRTKSEDDASPLQVLLGHKNGFPVFDVSWNQDGRALLSAGGDGSLRLWDTMAVGPFGEDATPSTSENLRAVEDTAGASPVPPSEGAMEVPGLHPSKVPVKNGAALVVYRGHAPSTPVFSVAFAPSGYYFCSTGGDSTARLWTTDRTSPVRLFSGHTSENINCVKWHPNCNYLVTGADDKTVRLWDVHSGRTVRLLTGCGSGVNVVEISPDGRFCAGADYSGFIYVWDLGNGKKISQFRPERSQRNDGMHVVRSLSFSSCGKALASGGDDCTVKIWDVSREIVDTPMIDTPCNTYPRKRTQILDLQYTKRNLLLGVGKFVMPVSQALTPEDTT